eukprot:2982163-Prymnesium_polylepis.1
MPLDREAFDVAPPLGRARQHARRLWLARAVSRQPVGLGEQRRVYHRLALPRRCEKVDCARAGVPL